MLTKHRRVLSNKFWSVYKSQISRLLSPSTSCNFPSFPPALPLPLPCHLSLHVSVPALPPPLLCLVRDDLALNQVEAAGTQEGLQAIFTQCQRGEEGQVGRWAQSGVPAPSHVPGGCHLGLGKHHLIMPPTHHAQNTQPHCELLTLLPANRCSTLTEIFKKEFQKGRGEKGSLTLQ